MIDIFYARFEQPLPAPLWKAYFNQLPAELQRKNASLLRWQDRHAHLIGKHLLLHALLRCGYPQEVLNGLRYNPYGRPFLTQDLDFNISHSGQWVVCAMATESRVGVDIEAIRAVDFSNFTNVMHPTQWEVIHRASDPTAAFFSYWTLKESVIKADGRGLFIPLSELHLRAGCISYQGRVWYPRAIVLDAHCAAHATSNQPDAEYTLRKVDLNSL